MYPVRISATITVCWTNKALKIARFPELGIVDIVASVSEKSFHNHSPDEGSDSVIRFFAKWSQFAN
jgi:hypothetical protein